MTVGTIIGNTDQPQGTAKGKVLDSMTGIGIELEVEGCTNYDELPSTFKPVTDGSLRNNGIEFILRQPLAGLKLENAIKNLDTFLKETSYTLSERCSTHIHVDVRDMTKEQLINMLCLSIMLEPLMFRVFGNNRTANTFCMATDMGTTNYDNIINLIACKNTDIRQRYSKYAGIGLYRLPDQGSVEYRMFSPITEYGDYIRVIKLLHAIKDEAMLMTSPNAIITKKLQYTANDLISLYFPELTHLEEYDALLERGVRTLNDMLLTARTVEIVEERSTKYKQVIRTAQERLNAVEQGI